MRLEQYKQRAAEAAEFLTRRGVGPADVVLQCGSGLADLASELLAVAARASISAIPHFPPITVSGHGNEAVYGQIGECRLLVLTGRLHVFEGHSPAVAGFPAALAAALGARLMICTNAAGALGEGLNPGELVVHSSYINFQGDNAAACLEFADSSQRFVVPDPAYDAGISEAMLDCLMQAGLTARRGVYIAVRGPVFETEAELRMMRAWGGEAIGMSTVPEVVVCHLLKLPVVGLSVLTNKCLGGRRVSHAEVLAASRAAVPELARALRTLLKEGRWR
jgi:purine-nucleoside phosphorylase